MQQGLRTELTRIALLAVALGIAGFFNGQVLLTLIVGGGLYMIWTLTKILRLYQWLEKGAKGLPPEATGVWGDISNQLYRLQKRNELAKINYRSLLKRLRKVTSALDEGLIILDAERCLDWWNPAAAHLLGLQEVDNRQPITNLIRSPIFVSFIQGGKFDLPLECPTSGNEQRILQFSARIFGDDELALVVQDVTRVRNLEDTRKDFVANISHELRTPLTVLTGYIETLQSIDQPELPPVWNKALAQMEQQATRMNLLTEDLMMLSRLESTPASTDETVQLCALIHPIIENAQDLSQGKHQISCTCEGSPSIAGNSKELHSAFANLTYNAVKHNPDGCDISIAINAGESTTTVAVKDNGCGIDPKHISRLTERFYRPDDGRSTQSGGTGLGLAIVKHVLIRHHGQLFIDSKLGHGSTFTCQFDHQRRTV
ncbi:MAG: phosphate regulon sensor histidine kinase PhoR [Gammaproteobacteria bacterium]|nr:MAG: phosphate regulon sensor histidine kinase PhoR [Gammaproteobacteria bacterium]RLA54391.1 MAG: phosphate regulon sensor histidine kinase PhoR [Gammaproteobacteria bacterium]